MAIRINRERLLGLFLDLVRIDAPSGREGALAGVLKSVLETMGLVVREDGTSGVTGSDSGNLIGLLAADRPGIRPLFFSAHMDTIETTAGLEPKVENGMVLAAGAPILGADDRAGIAVIIEALRALREEGLPHGDIEVVFTTAEETGLKGAKALSPADLKSTMGYVLDSGDRVGTAVCRAPAEFDFDVSVTGRAAHAGAEPEKGVSAVTAAVRALSRLPQGRLDPETTCNVGVISGGKVTNIVPDAARVLGEVRSLNEARARQVAAEVRRVFEEEAAALGAAAQVSITQAYSAFELQKGDPVLRLFAHAARSVGLPPKLVSRGGGSDANIFNHSGLSVTNLGLGMIAEHSPGERVAVDDLTRAAALVAAIITENAREPTKFEQP